MGILLGDAFADNNKLEAVIAEKSTHNKTTCKHYQLLIIYPSAFIPLMEENLAAATALPLCLIHMHLSNIFSYSCRISWYCQSGVSCIVKYGSSWPVCGWSCVLPVGCQGPVEQLYSIVFGNASTWHNSLQHANGSLPCSLWHSRHYGRHWKWSMAFSSTDLSFNMGVFKCDMIRHSPSWTWLRFFLYVKIQILVELESSNCFWFKSQWKWTSVKL